MNRLIPISLIIFSLATLAGCKKYDGSKAAADRRKWVESLNDSLALVNKQRAADSLEIIRLRSEIDSEICNFTQVSNPREVESYYILSTFKGNYPLTSTGVAARITNGMEFELIAALSGKKFDAVRVTSPTGASATSMTIPPDQALNFTDSNGLTVVAFSGGINDSLGRFVANNPSELLRMEYLRSGATQASINLSDAQKKWISSSWQLANNRSTLDSLENHQIIYARKLQILHITIDREKRKAQGN